MAFGDSALLLDNFNRANAADLGANWVTDPGATDSMHIDTNVIRSTAGVFSGNLWNVSQFGPDCECHITAVSAGAGQNSLYLRHNGTTTFYLLYVNLQSGNGWTIYNVTAGSATALGATVVQGVANGEKIGFSAVGTTLEGYLFTGGSWVQVLSRTDGGISGAGYAGFRGYNNSGIFDDFYAGSIGADATKSKNLLLLGVG